MAIGTYISIITLNGNGLSTPTKRHRLAEWIQKQDPCIYCLQETHFRPKDTYRLKVRGWRNQKLFRQAKVKRIQYHLTSFTTNVKGTYIVKKYKRRKISKKINPKQLRKWQ